MKKHKTKYNIGDKVRLINNQVVIINDIDDDDIAERLCMECAKGLYNLNYNIVFDNDDSMWTSLPNIKGIVLELLTEEERAYLSNIVKPLKKDSITDIFIYKTKSQYTGRESISIDLFEHTEYSTSIHLPSFENGKYYNGLELYYNYSLEELGI